MRVTLKMAVPAMSLLFAFHVQGADAAKGKEIYSKTCKQCHGPDGKGYQIADKFFQTTIPRLSSDYVQSKPDAELREIITSGRRKMDPVRMGQPQARHNLAADEVDDVISFVRTFKKKK